MHDFSVNPATLLVHLEKPPSAYDGTAPIEEVVMAGLSSPGVYWTERAVGWLEAGFPLSPAMVQQLETLAASLHRSHQSLRHRCAAVVRKWHKESGL